MENDGKLDVLVLFFFLMRFWDGVLLCRFTDRESWRCDIIPPVDEKAFRQYGSSLVGDRGIAGFACGVDVLCRTEGHEPGGGRFG